MPKYVIQAAIGHLPANTPRLVLDADVAAGASTITVQSIIGVAVNNILLFREVGNERAEIIATHAATAPSGNTVTLVSTIIEAHPAGTIIYVIPWNQVRFYHSATEDDANASDTNLSALAAAQNIDPSRNVNTYEDQAQTAGYYYYRFSDAVNSVNDIYSDPIPWNFVIPQFEENEVGEIIEQARKSLGKDWDTRFSKQDAITEVNACLIYMGGKLKRWARYLEADSALGATERGVFDYALPTDIYDNETNRSILQIRLVGASRSTVLTPKDEKEFDALMGEAKRTTVRTLSVVDQSTLEIVNSYDFSATGSVHVFTSNTDDVITYTGVTRSATVGVLTGIATDSTAGAITAAHAAGQNVWQDHDEGRPLYFNIREGRVRIWPMPDATWINFNVWGDYYTEATRVNSESDTIDADRFDAVKYFLKWKMRTVWDKNGIIDLTDGDYLMFRDILTQQIRTAIIGQKSKWYPRINSIRYNRGIRRSDDFDRSS